MNDELRRLLNPDTIGDAEAERRLCVLLLRRTGVDNYDFHRDIEPFHDRECGAIPAEVAKQWGRWAVDTRAINAANLLRKHAGNGYDIADFEQLAKAVRRNATQWGNLNAKIDRATQRRWKAKAGIEERSMPCGVFDVKP